jgi:signal transduction histidine kinase
MNKKIIWAIAIVFLSLAKGNGQSINNDSISRLKNKLNVLKDDSARVWALWDISDAYLYNTDSGLAYSLKAVKLSHELNYKEGELQSLLKIEIILSHTGNAVKAFSVSKRGLKLALEYNNLLFQAHFLGELGIILGGSINFGAALNYLRHSKALYDSIHEPDYSAFMDNNIGEVYLNKGSIDSALFYFKACSNAKTHDSSFYWVKFYATVNLGKIYLLKTNYTKALSYFKTALPVALFYDHFFNCNLYIAKTYFYLNERDSCLRYANKAMKIATESRINSELEEANAFFAHIYEKEDPVKALQYNRTALNHKDSSILYNEKLAIEQLDEFDKQERQYEIESAQIKYRNKVKTYGYVSSALVLMIIVLILQRNNRHKQKINKTLKEALSNLKSTQSQLIQSEKMASLGELTAGIAHEIQNPLNFVNNFSEVNKELLIEMKDEMNKGNIDDANAIADDVIDNSEKINHHGKRADAIVKGMLQHSRSSTGVKEPTNINALADEYLRLSYHGLRAKDKEFNAIMKTDFDNAIGSINIIPQDIGRVLLNLYNNAFYAVTEKKKQQSEGYEPTVSVSTKKIGDKVEVKVKDNGNGIPQKVVDKIFQPFFTTKPTGQGTGLGLSLSYDIIKTHGGEIKVETKEGDPGSSGKGEGSTFIIQLPINKV